MLQLIDVAITLQDEKSRDTTKMYPGKVVIIIMHINLSSKCVIYIEATDTKFQPTV